MIYLILYVYYLWRFVEPLAKVLLFFLAPDSLVSLVFGGTSLRHAIVDTLRLRVKLVTAYLFTSIKLFTVAYPSVGITLSVNHIYTSVSFQFLLSTTCYNAVKSLILRKKGKRNSVGK